ncbi:MAG TPA: hypothetical protein VHR47_11325, partial [Bacillota bacterium]|nr:hypothetical protein [Bacillota bacterium]
EDGGFFYQYKKRFSGLKIEAVIEFTGVPLPEENVKVALKNLYFTQIEEGDSGYFGSENLISLEDIPPVLLSETWNDLRRIAEAGDGFDAQWEKKVAY